MARRLGKEFSDINSANHEWVKVQLVDDNLFKWRSLIKGPEGSPYEGGVFNIELEYPNEYPFKPPKVKFITKTYHPNIRSSAPDQMGHICLPILTESWSPQLKAFDVLTAIKDILITPEVGHPVEAEIAQQYVNDKEKFIKTAKDWTKKNAK